EVLGLGDRDVFVVLAGRGFRARRENRLVQLLRELEATRQSDARDLARFTVILPARADQVAAYDGFDRQRLEVVHHDRAAFDDGMVARVFEHVCGIDTGEMVRNDVRELVEPEVRDRREYDAFAGNGVRQYDIECRHTVRREDQQAF